jgi:type II secretory pathway pseudopilin PulG
MRSVTCASCGLVSWADGGNCKRCGKPLPINQALPEASPPPPPQGYGAGHSYGAGPDHFGAPPKKRVGHAAASLAIGVIGFFSLGIFLIGSVVGTVLGIVALKRESREPAKYGGKGMAIAGIVLNIVSVVAPFAIAIIAAIAIPNLLASRRAANEASALSSIRKINLAEHSFYSMTGENGYGDLSQLSNLLNDPELAGGHKHGYHFNVVCSGHSYVVSATPDPNAGNRSFFYTSVDDQIHVRHGRLPATANDPPLEAFYDSPPARRGSQPELRGPAYIPSR